MFSKPVMNVTPLTFVVQRANAAERECATAGQSVTGHVSSNRTADVWTFKPDHPLAGGEYCIAITGDVYDLTGQTLRRPFTTRLKVAGPPR